MCFSCCCKHRRFCFGWTMIVTKFLEKKRVWDWVRIGRFYIRGRIICLDEHLLFVWLFVSSIKTGTRRIRLDELFFVVRRSRRTAEDNSCRRIMRPVPVFQIPETYNQTNNKYFPKFVLTDNTSSSMNRAIFGL